LDYINEEKKQERARILKRPSTIIASPIIQGAMTAKLLSLKGTKTSTTFKIMGGIALALHLFNLSTMTYQFYLSKAAKACKGDKFKLACIDEYKARATEAQIAVLTKNKSKCKKTDNPRACERVIDKKITELKQRVRALKRDAKYFRSPGHLFK